MFQRTCLLDDENESKVDKLGELKLDVDILKVGISFVPYEAVDSKPVFCPEKFPNGLFEPIIDVCIC